MDGFFGKPISSDPRIKGGKVLQFRAVQRFTGGLGRRLAAPSAKGYGAGSVAL